MKLRLTRTAARQLDTVLADIARHHPPGADAVLDRIRATLNLLLRYPHAGQMTHRRGIRQIVVSRYPDILTYRVDAAEIVIRSVRHAARRPRV